MLTDTFKFVNIEPSNTFSINRSIDLDLLVNTQFLGLHVRLSPVLSGSLVYLTADTYDQGQSSHGLRKPQCKQTRLGIVVLFSPMD